MWWFLLFVQIVMWIIVATLSLMSFFEDNHHPDGDDIAMYTFLSLLKGLIWPITIWVALAIWVSKRETPYWAENIKFVFNLCRGKTSNE